MNSWFTMTKQMNKPSSLHRGGKPNFVGHSLREHRHQHQSSRFYQLFQYTTNKITDKPQKKKKRQQQQSKDWAYKKDTMMTKALG